jgi:hypothetical protein
MPGSATTSVSFLDTEGNFMAIQSVDSAAGVEGKATCVITSSAKCKMVVEKGEDEAAARTYEVQPGETIYF